MYLYNPKSGEILDADATYVVLPCDIGWVKDHDPSHDMMDAGGFQNAGEIIREWANSEPVEEHKIFMVNRIVGRKLVPGAWCYLHKRWE